MVENVKLYDKQLHLKMMSDAFGQKKRSSSLLFFFYGIVKLFNNNSLNETVVCVREFQEINTCVVDRNAAVSVQYLCADKFSR
jgi:hypothetical protein